MAATARILSVEDHIRDHDKPHRFPKAGQARCRRFEWRFVAKQPCSDPQIARCADQLEKLDLQQACGEGGGGHQRNHGTGCPGNQRPVSHGPRKRFSGRGNHHGVVSAQSQIDHEDRERAKDELPVRELMEGIQIAKSSLIASPLNGLVGHSLRTYLCETMEVKS